MNNPLEILPETFFIAGPMPQEGFENPDFKRFEDILMDKGYKVFNPQAQENCNDERVRLCFLGMCDKVITLPGCDTDARAKKELIVARAFGKELIFAEGFERWEQRKKLAEEQNS